MNEERQDREALDPEDLFLKRVFRDFGEIVWKDKVWIAAYVLFVLGAAFIWSFGQTPYYKAEATLLVDPARVENAEEKASLNNLALQEALIKSPEVIDLVMTKTKLLAAPLFAESRNPQEVFLKLMEIQSDRQAKTISVGFIYTNAEEASAIANEIAKTYLMSKSNKSSGSSQDSIAKLQEQAQQELKKLNGIKSSIAELNKKYPDLGDEGIVDEQIRSLNTQFIETDARILQLKTNLSEIEELLEQGSAIDNHPFVRENPRVKETMERIRALELEVIELQQEYRGMHPLVVKAQMKLSAIKQTLVEEKKQIVEDLREELRSREVSRRQIQASMLELQTKKKELTPQKLAYKNFLTEEETVSETIRLLNSQISKSSVTASMKNPGVEILKYAMPPPVPFKPNKPKILFFAFVFAAISSFGPLFLLCYSDQSLKRSEDVEQTTHKPFLGQVPLVAPAKGSMDPKFRNEEEKVYFMNFLRLACANINFLVDSDRSTTIMITGSKPGEGKSFVSYHLAKAFAREGRKTVLVDADFCHTTVSLSFPQEGEQAGLHDYLMEKVESDKIVRATDQPNLYLISSKESKFSAPHALRSERMKSLLQTLKNEFNMIILDAPPVLSLNDAVALGELVDMRILVVEWGKTTRHDVLRALSKVAPSKLLMAGVILNKVRHLEKNYYYNSKYPADAKPATSSRARDGKDVQASPGEKNG